MKSYSVNGLKIEHSESAYRSGHWARLVWGVFTPWPTCKLLGEFRLLKDARKFAKSRMNQPGPRKATQRRTEP